jgi:hypothetical protein
MIFLCSVLIKAWSFQDTPPGTKGAFDDLYPIQNVPVMEGYAIQTRISLKGRGRKFGYPIPHTVP